MIFSARLWICAVHERHLSNGAIDFLSYLNSLSISSMKIAFVRHRPKSRRFLWTEIVCPMAFSLHLRGKLSKTCLCPSERMLVMVSVDHYLWRLRIAITIQCPKMATIVKFRCTTTKPFNMEYNSMQRYTIDTLRFGVPRFSLLHV